METHLRKNSFLIILGFLIFDSSCTFDSGFNQYKAIENSTWNATDIVNFSFEIRDTISPKNVFINIRNNNKYPFSNLYLITALSFPNGTKIVDTLHYEMADVSGKFLGNGLSEIKGNKLFYKESKVFPASGMYSFEVRHAMRKNGKIAGISSLKGITDVGFSIEKIN